MLGTCRALHLKPEATTWAYPAGLAAQHQPSTAVRLLVLLLALQATFTLLALALRPYISAVLNGMEVVCGCLDMVSIALTAAAYVHTSGSNYTRADKDNDPHLAVRCCGRLQLCFGDAAEVPCTVTQPTAPG